MIKIQNPEHFTEVMAFALNNKCAGKLLDGLDFLSQYGGGPDCTSCTLCADFAPHSFTFVIESNGKFWFNGGLIYSGPGQPLDGSFPALTVSLEATGADHAWSVHT